MKNTLGLALVLALKTKLAGLELPGPALMSRTRDVLAAVPSADHNSAPLLVVLSVATNNTLDPANVIEDGTTFV